MERRELIEIYEETVRRLAGDRLVEEALHTGAPVGPVRVMALGKAAASMWAGAERVLGPLSGIGVGPAGSWPQMGPASADAAAEKTIAENPGARQGKEREPQRRENTRHLALPPSRVEWLKGEHPVPGRGSLHAGERLLAFASSLHPHETALVLLSGGASALAEALPPSISLEDLAATTKLLLSSGASIDSFNVVRKHLSLLKGGRLAAACRAGRIEVLTISDVFGDDPAVIGSGPFAPDPSTFADALQVVASLPVPPSIRQWLEEGAAGLHEETPKELPNVHTRILSGPLHLAETAARVARERDLAAEASPLFLGADVEEVAEQHARTLRSHHGTAKLVAYASEPTVRLPPDPGLGGRSQHLALRLLPHLATTGAAFLAAGSDGQDGMGEAAGAAVDGTTAALAGGAGVDIEEALHRADSATASRALGVALPARRTGTNLADLHLLALPHRGP